jgi:hypothetical protein
MKCPNCPQITAHDDGDPEVTSEPEETEGSAAPELTVRRLRVCADCGEELKEAELEITCNDPAFTGPTAKDAEAKGFALAEDEEYDPEACPARRAEESKDEADPLPCEFEWEVDGDPENTDRSDSHDRHGKPIKSARYRRTYYGVSVNLTGTCKHCGATATTDGEDSVMASGMDELV